jgi:DNA polymerase-3 subunit delta'
MWQRVISMRERMPHAILLHGRHGIGKLAFARSLANALLCESPDSEGFACGICLSCGWMDQDNHPDFRLLEPEDKSESESDDSLDATSSAARSRKKSRYILVNQVRALSDLVGLSAHRHGLRIVVVHPAEVLNPNAANALLKMLEEPPPATLFLLVTHQLQRLLPTILSRCHKIAMRLPSLPEAADWLATQGIVDPAFCLAQSGGAPLMALEANNAVSRETVEAFVAQLSLGERIDPFAPAAHWSKEDFALSIVALQKWSYDLASARLAGQVRYFPARSSTLQALGKSVDLRRLLDFQRKLVEARAQAEHPLNNELQMEALLVRYAQLFPGITRT